MSIMTQLAVQKLGQGYDASWYRVVQSEPGVIAHSERLGPVLIRMLLGVISRQVTPRSPG